MIIIIIVIKIISIILIITQTEFSFSTIHDGNAIPKLIAPGPSGFPYFSQFFLDSSSVKA